MVAVFAKARPHHAYLFANRRATRMKMLVHDGIGVSLAARRLNRGGLAILTLLSLCFSYVREPA